MKKKLFLLVLVWPYFALSQEEFCWMTYNVENLFDTSHDSLKNDREFLPDATRRWTYSRYQTKQDHIARCIIATGGWKPPALVALCEVENKAVLQYLTRYSALREAGYRYVMTHGPDLRGINVALLYQREYFRLLHYQGYRIDFPPALKHLPTRDILHVSGEILSGDTLDLFVVHLPSRRNGRKESEPARLFAAQKLKELADSLLQCRKLPLVIIMGDFNDPPQSHSLKKTIGCLPPPGTHSETEETIHPLSLYNLVEPLSNEKTGTYKYQGNWEILDHILVSGTLLLPGSPLFIPSRKAEIVRHPFLLEHDPKEFGIRPFRTYQGFRYHGGYSDHLPVVVKGVVREE